MSDCKHARGDWIKDEGYWLCADCFGKMDGRPTRYGFNMMDGAVKGEQIIVWQAALAQADSVSLNDFLRAMVRRYMKRTSPQIRRDDAYSAAIEFLKCLEDPYGDPSYCWTVQGAIELADEDMSEWDGVAGNQ